RKADIAMAIGNRMWVIRSDVAGSNGKLVSYGSSEIVDPEGAVVQTARRRMGEDLIVAEIGTTGRG
ncbi:MAG TPA: nitrilase-related carbon-nitrogen hydrolase, partial [Bryobacteraceae bacterium]|nr:nitrilase-related carbon-nitrogen hydrolase [Bryobacteraceae bacterium]